MNSKILLAAITFVVAAAIIAVPFGLHMKALAVAIDGLNAELVELKTKYDELKTEYDALTVPQPNIVLVEVTIDEGW